MIPPLLQSQIQFFSTPTRSQNTKAIAIVALILIAFLAWVILSRRASGQSGAMSRGSFRKRARKLELSKDQIHLLEDLIKKAQFSSPTRVLENPAALDILLRRSLAGLETDEKLTPEEKEGRKARILGIKQTIDRNSEQQKIIASTLSLPINTPVTIRTKEGWNHESYVTSNMQNMIGMASPASGDRSKPHPWPKGEELGIILVRGGGAEVYAFKTKVLGYKMVRGALSVFTEHGKNLRQIQNRRNRRREIDRPAIIYPVGIVESGKGKKMVREAVVNTAQRSLGSLVDISAGGCAVMARNLLPRASLVKIDFETEEGKAVSVYGKILGITPQPPRGGIMHVRFTRVSRTHLNAVREYVYGYLPERRD